MMFLNKSDIAGKTEAYNTLMQTNDLHNYDEAHELALSLVDETLIQGAREAMIGVNPKWALRRFLGYDHEKIKDSPGVDYVLGIVASQHGVDQGDLRHLVDSYRKDL